MTGEESSSRRSGSTERYDVIVIGAGVSGMYALHHLRQMGPSVRVYDGATDVGGTWWYNHYSGARVDGPGSPFYCYTFSDELMNECPPRRPPHGEGDARGGCLEPRGGREAPRSR